MQPKTLQANPDIEAASHKILAWRKVSKQASIHPGVTNHETGSDEDGEKWAGKKLESVLEHEKVTGALVVARWYGGTMLGPVRFTHIETCGKKAIAAWRHAVEEQESEKKRKTEDDAERLRLLEELPERDDNILALRKLLADKGENPADAKQPASSPQAIDYTKMPAEVLRRLEKARDSTISVLLKKIDETELKQKAKAADAASIT